MLRLLLVALLCALAPLGHAHDIPADVAVRAFVKPEGERLGVLLRVPLKALRDVDVPRRGPGYLDFDRAGPALRHAVQVWITDNLELREGDAPLGEARLVATRVSLESQRTFGSYAEARAHIHSPALPSATELYWEQGLLDVELEYAIRSDRSAFSIHPRFDRLGARVATTLHFLPPGSPERVFQLAGDPGLVHLDPGWHQAAWLFVKLGFGHILEGSDHLLFLACLLLPFRRLAPLALIVTSFTVAHSLTLIGAALGTAPDALWFPPLVETLIAASILYMALENVVGANERRRWMLTFAFGLVHGFGFAFGLQHSLQFAGDHLLLSLLAFNAGVEAGQLLVLVVALPVANAVLGRLVPERIGIVIASVLVAHTAWHWLQERAATLAKFPLPALDAASAAAALRWAMAALALAALVWLVDRFLLARLRGPR